MNDTTTTASRDRLLTVAPRWSGSGLSHGTWYWECAVPRCHQAGYSHRSAESAWAAADSHDCSDPISAGMVVTDPEVYAGIAAGVADPELDPALIDWRPRQIEAWVPFAVVLGRPFTPGHPNGTFGRLGLYRWGENKAADALVTCTHAGRRYLLMVERADGHGWALPGGGVDPGETGPQAALRELVEETGIALTDVRQATVWPARLVPDPRATDESWAVTVPYHLDLAERDALPDVTGGDDAACAEWLPADSYADLTGHLDGFGGTVFAAHVGMLRDLLDPARAAS